MKLTEKLNRLLGSLVEELTQDDLEQIGAMLRNSSYFQVSPIDGESGTYMIKVYVAGRQIIEIKTKLDEETGQIIYDSYEVEEDELKSLIEFIENRKTDRDYGEGE